MLLQVSELTLKQLVKLQLKSGTRPPLLIEVLRSARHLGAYMQAQLHTAAEREAAERYRTPEAVMRETASSRAFQVHAKAVHV